MSGGEEYSEDILRGESAMLQIWSKLMMSAIHHDLNSISRDLSDQGRMVPTRVNVQPDGNFF